MNSLASKLNFSLTQLEYVLAVHKTGHFSDAAKQCHVTQPTLSMQIQKLEEHLDTVLFDRSKKPILLTEKGKALVAQMQAIVFEARKIEMILTQQSGQEVTGTLTVGIIPTVAPYLLPLLLPQVEKSFPGISLNVREMQTNAIMSALHADEIDVGILAIPLSVNSIFEKVLYTETFSVLCQKKHPIAKLKHVSQNMLSAEEIWLLEEGHCLRSQTLDVCALNTVVDSKTVKRKFQFDSGSLETLKSLVHTYGGYTLLPSLAATNVSSNTSIVPFAKPVPARDIGMVYVREHYKSDLLHALAESVLAAVPLELKDLKRKDIDVIPAV